MLTPATDLRSSPPLDRRAAVELGRTEYALVVDTVRTLDGDDWARPTDCDGWTVRDLLGHVAGAMVSAASFRAFMREQGEVRKRQKTTGEAEIDAMTAVQIQRVADLSRHDLIELMASLIDAAADGRGRVPAVVARLVTFKVELPGVAERWRLDYLMGTILTRDTWLHRVADLARAVGSAPTLDTSHDSVIVADIAAEWARRHGQCVELSLTGPAGGRFTAGTGGPVIEVDAIDFCRMLSRRAEPAHPLLATAVPF